MRGGSKSGARKQKGLLSRSCHGRVRRHTLRPLVPVKPVAITRRIVQAHARGLVCAERRATRRVYPSSTSVTTMHRVRHAQMAW